ncbi:TPA: hypothetical protein ACGO0M_002140 [Streptococcus suis]
MLNSNELIDILKKEKREKRGRVVPYRELVKVQRDKLLKVERQYIKEFEKDYWVAGLYQIVEFYKIYLYTNKFSGPIVNLDVSDKKILGQFQEFRDVVEVLKFIYQYGNGMIPYRVLYRKTVDKEWFEEKSRGWLDGLKELKKELKTRGLR